MAANKCSTEQRKRNSSKGARFGFLGKCNGWYTETMASSLMDGLFDFLAESSDNVLIQEYFSFQGVHSSTVDYLCNAYPSFKARYLTAKQYAASKMLKQSMYKEADLNTCKFVLTNNHKEDNWQDKTHQQIEAKVTGFDWAMDSQDNNDMDLVKDNPDLSIPS